MVWPEVQAMLVVPLSAHALFNRPMVLSPGSQVQFELGDPRSRGIMWCDGRRSVEVSDEETICIRASNTQLRIARLGEQPFTTRLVKKFKLPVDGWRRGDPGGVPTC